MKNKRRLPSGTHARILLVTHDVKIAKKIDRLLQKCGKDRFPLHLDMKLPSALKYLHQNTCDLVLLDLDLPNYGGEIGFEILTAAFPQIPIIVLSGQIHDPQSVSCVTEGAQDFLVKNELEAKILVRSIRYAIRTHFMQRDLIQYIQGLPA